MLKVLVISLLFLSACSKSHRFDVGDCIIIDNNTEEWEKVDQINMNIYQVLEIGKEKYRIDWVNPTIMKGQHSNDYIRSVDRIYSKIDCPKVEKPKKRGL